VSISWQMDVNQSTGSTSNFGPFFGIEANDANVAGKQIAAFGVDSTTGQILVYDQNAGGLNTTPNDPTVAFGQLNNFLLTLNYTTFTYAVTLNGKTLETNLPFFAGNDTQFTDADIAALQDAPTNNANQSASAIFDNYLITNSTGSLPIPNIIITTGQTITAVTDAGIGPSGDLVEFAGGTLAVNGSFATPRPITIDSTGGTISVLPATTFTINAPSLTWAKATLATANTGAVVFALNSAAVSIQTGSTLSISSGSSVAIAGTTDPFTDTSNSSNHVAIVDNGSLAFNGPNSSIAGISGTGQLTIGTGSTTNKLQLAANSGASSIGSLTINSGASLDLSNNHLFINYGAGADPKATILSYLQTGYNAGAWNGPGIDSSSAAADLNYGIGFADSADAGNPAKLSTGQIELKYTLYGDANLDGVVSGVDFTILVGNLNKSVSGWDKGDFNYDGVVSGVDFTLLVSNLGRNATGADIELPASDFAAIGAFAAANGLLADVPEPASATLLSALGLTLLSRRRRNR
ncbi:MAG TPA: dockerin type I repeat-containing protein, partial [Tepidisphaeraceae bacterium]